MRDDSTAPSAANRRRHEHDLHPRPARRDAHRRLRLGAAPAADDAPRPRDRAAVRHAVHDRRSSRMRSTTRPSSRASRPGAGQSAPAAGALHGGDRAARAVRVRRAVGQGARRQAGAAAGRQGTRRRTIERSDLAHDIARARGVRRIRARTRPSAPTTEPASTMPNGEARLGGDAHAREARVARTPVPAPRARTTRISSVVPGPPWKTRSSKVWRSPVAGRVVEHPAAVRSATVQSCEVREVLDGVAFERERHGEDELAAGLQKPARIDERARDRRAPRARTHRWRSRNRSARHDPGGTSAMSSRGVRVVPGVLVARICARAGARTPAHRRGRGRRCPCMPRHVGQRAGRGRELRAITRRAIARNRTVEPHTRARWRFAGQLRPARRLLREPQRLQRNDGARFRRSTWPSHVADRGSADRMARSARRAGRSEPRARSGGGGGWREHGVARAAV